jgi:hypothetical protein
MPYQASVYDYLAADTQLALTPPPPPPPYNILWEAEAIAAAEWRRITGKGDAKSQIATCPVARPVLATQAQACLDQLSESVLLTKDKLPLLPAWRDELDYLGHQCLRRHINDAQFAMTLPEQTRLTWAIDHGFIRLSIHVFYPPSWGHEDAWVMQVVAPLAEIVVHTMDLPLYCLDDLEFVRPIPAYSDDEAMWSFTLWEEDVSAEVA